MKTSQVLHFHWRQAMNFPKLIWTSFIVGPISIISERYIAPLAIAALIDGIQRGAISLESSWHLVAIYAAILIFAQVIGYRVNMRAMWGVQVEGAKKIYLETYKKLITKNISYFNDNFTGSIVSNTNRLSSAFMSFWNLVIFELMFTVVSLFATIIGTAIFMWQLSIALIVLVAIFVVASYFGTKFMRPRQRARSQAYSDISAKLSDSISNIFAVKIDGREKYEFERFENSTDDLVRKELHVRSGTMRISSVYSSIIVVGKIIVLLGSILSAQNGSANAAVVYIVLTYTLNLLDEMRNITSIFRSVYSITGDSEDMLEALADSSNLEDQSSKKAIIKSGAISIDAINFTHTDDTSPLFHKLSLNIPAGQKIGVIGRSGSGKTTLTKILLKFLKPQEGDITIDGASIFKVSNHSLRSKIAFVAQEPALFHRTLRENIAYGRPGASDESIKQAAKQANAWEFIKNMPDGLDTIVGERGVKLSGGQRQRVAIARAILKDAPILVLDEATSALDSESEKLIQDSLDTLMKNRTSIVIAHRLSTIAKLDRIIVLDNGKIVEDGTHKQLLKQNGTYAKLWNHQSGGFIEDDI